MAEPSNDSNHTVVDDRTVMAGATPTPTATPTAPSRAAPTGRAATTIVAETGSILPVGTRIEEFEITGLVGQGGFGIVYVAHDHSLDRTVALKEYMPSSLATRHEGGTVTVRSERHAETFQTGLRSFVNEARLLARFDHPSLVKVYRFWESNGTAYMVMPLYRGVTLGDRLKAMAEPPSEDWLRRMLGSLLDALEVIHAEKVFHRDISPDNILLLDEDRPVLLDFGAARRVIGDLTHGLTVILKPGYAPIEQYAEIEAMKQGPWTDIYALAATIYFAIAGKAPEPAVGRFMSDKLVPLKELARGRYGEPFLAAIDAALRVKPDDRPQNVQAFRQLLATAGPTPAPQERTRPAPTVSMPAPGPVVSLPETPKHEADGARPSRTPLMAAGLAALVLSGVAGYYFLSGGGDGHGETPPVTIAPPAVPSAPPAVTPEPAPRPKAEPAPAREPAPAPETTAAPPAPSPTSTEAPAVAEPPPPPMKPKPRARPVPPRVDEPTPTASREEQNPRLSDLVAQAQQSLSRREYRRALGLAEKALALDPANSRAIEIRRLAREGEKKAFDEIKIE